MSFQPFFQLVFSTFPNLWTDASRSSPSSSDINGPDEATLSAEHRFNSTVGSYLIALRVGVLDIEHSPAVLTHFGRFGVEYDACCRLFVEDLRQLACYGGSSGGSSAAKVIVESLKDVSLPSFSFIVSNEMLTSLSSSLSVLRPLRRRFHPRN